MAQTEDDLPDNKTVLFSTVTFYMVVQCFVVVFKCFKIAQKMNLAFPENEVQVLKDIQQLEPMASPY